MLRVRQLTVGGTVKTTKTPQCQYKRTYWDSKRQCASKQRMMVCRAGQGVEPPESADEDARSELRLLLDLIVQYPATRGTIAVALGWLTHINPLITFHWDQHHFLIGLLFALPIAGVDALIMVPSWQPDRIEKKVTMVVPKDVASTLEDAVETSTTGEKAKVTAVSEHVTVTDLEEGTPEMVEVERPVSMKAQQKPWRDALRREQLERVMNNAGQLLSPTAEALLLLLVHVSEEMLYRGFALTFAVKWTTDRFYEAFGEDAIMIGNSVEVPTSLCAAITASVVLTVSAIYLLLSKDLKAIQMLENLEEKSTKSEKEDELISALASIKSTIIAQQKWGLAVTGLSEAAQWSSASFAYLMTGNLLAPIVSALVSDALCSYWQRRKLKVIQEELVREAEERAKKAKERTVLINAIKHNKQIGQGHDNQDP